MSSEDRDLYILKKIIQYCAESVETVTRFGDSLETLKSDNINITWGSGIAPLDSHARGLRFKSASLHQSPRSLLRGVPFLSAQYT